MTGDWAYDALVPIAGLEVTILGLAVTSSIIRRRHGLVPLRCHNLQSVRLSATEGRADANLMTLICAPGSG
jgi:hypothetical protein